MNFTFSFYYDIICLQKRGGFVVSENISRIKENNNYDIFKFLRPNHNTKLSDMNKQDVKELNLLLDKYYLELRNKLNLNKDFSFGLEIEFEYLSLFVDPFAIDKDLEKKNLNNEWYTSYESTVGHGAEISSPIMYDNMKYWKQLESVCDSIKKHARTSEFCGGHIHVGAHVLENELKYWLNFLKLWSVYENIIFRFCYGEYLTARPRLNYYALQRESEFSRVYKKAIQDGTPLKNIIDELAKFKYSAVNLEEVKDADKFAEYNTIEFRNPNGTLEPIVWQNYVNLLTKLLKYCKSDNFNNDIIDKRNILNLSDAVNYRNYSLINIEQAIELSDLIFDKNIDKIYFLRQYLKSGDVGLSYFEPAKNFILKK